MAEEAGSGPQAAIHGGVEHGDHVCDLPIPCGQPFQYLLLPSQPMGAIGGQERRRLGDRRTVGRP